MTEAPPSNPLWQFSVAFYARPGVKAACLDWQERLAADVNVLLLCCWHAGEGRLLPEADLRKLLADALLCHWRQCVVVPLRQARRHSGQSALGGEPVAAQRQSLYRALLDAELQAERAQQQFLWCWAQGMPAQTSRLRPALAARHNLLRYARCLGASAAGVADVAPFIEALDATA